MAPDTKESFVVGLSHDGLFATLHQATPEVFRENKRMRLQMRDKYKKNDSRVIAHNEVVQEIRLHDKAKDHKNWGDELQRVKLPFKSEGTVRKKWSYHPTVMVNGQQQYRLVLSLFCRGVKKMIVKEKDGEDIICEAPPEDSDDEDIDAESGSEAENGGGDGDDDDFMNAV